MRVLFQYIGFSSCTLDDGGFSDLKKQENEILLKVHSNTPEVPIRVYGVGANGNL